MIERALSFQSPADDRSKIWIWSESSGLKSDRLPPKLIAHKNDGQRAMCRAVDVVGAEAWGVGRGIGEKGACGDPWPVEEACRFYRDTLGDAAMVANRSVSKGFEESRRKTFGDFEDFLGKVGQGKRVENASGLDVIAFVHGFWIPKHKDQCRTFVNGKRMASASAVKGVVQHIAKSYSMLGYTDLKNPAKTECVKNYRDGYRNRLHDQGVREQRAKVMKPGKVADLAAYIETEIDKAFGARRCCLIADLAIVHYLWETWSRGKECGELEARQVDKEEGTITTGWTKTQHIEGGDEIPVQRGGNFMQAASRLVSSMEQLGHPIENGYLFRPLNRNRNGFENEPLRSDAMRRRLQKHLKAAGLYEGETLHSFRRSAVQHSADIEGYDVKRLMEFGRWKSYAAFRLYVEEIEHRFKRS
jgi:integrase